jgi:DNA-binding SARP family transcriptional activator
VRPLTVRLLGPTRVMGAEGWVSLGGPHPRALLAATALDAGRVVPLERIVDLLWGDRPPRDERATVQQTATRVRRCLVTAGFGNVLRAAPPGYVLDLPVDAVDALEFRALLRAAQQSRREQDAEGAVRSLSTALALWEDRALADLGMLPIASLGQALDEERWRAEELRATVLLELQQYEEAAAHLREATAREPLREQLWVLHARALARAGRLDEATRCARTAVAVITSELGVPPSPALAGLEATLAQEAPVRVVPPRPARPPYADPHRPLLGAALERAIASADHAARAAAARAAYDEAVRQWQRALELAEVATPADRYRHLGLLLELGEAHNQASSADEARAVFVRAAELARSLEDVRAFARAALGYCAQHISFHPPPEQAAMLREALDLLGETDEPLLRSRLLARLATEEYWNSPLDHTASLADEALRQARRSGNTEALLDARFAAAFGVWSPVSTPRLVEVATAHLDEARAAGNRLHEYRARRWLATALTELGDLRGAELHLADTLRLADELNLPVEQWFARCVASSHAMALGDLVDAERLASDALAIGSTVEPEVALDYVSLLIWNCRWLQGRLDEIVDMVEAVAGTPGVELPRRLGLALARADLGNAGGARLLLDEITTEELEAMPVNGSWWPGMAALAETVALVPHPHAAWALEKLAPFRDRIGITQATMTGPVVHQIGVCAWALDRRPEALAALEEAVGVADRVGLPVFAARSRLALAERLVVMGDRRPALVLAEEARSAAHHLGLRGVERAALALLHLP